ncbi:MAG: glutamine--fructose-6-phosphate transaminase (isomerizing) [Deltaproteobacteria bacterium]|jgi:glucosamine--fructose-6-phosphate aminotransferase (isomerizing)|nr:glutamine--fructose-6-phosphate transaminase (isomerizing) [Deltaproteobacteria bacterium]
MCGIIGYLGPRETKEVLLEGLRRLEYRGYDSAGIALYHEGKVVIRRSTGKLRELEKKIAEEHFSGKIGIGHTRWATHGRPSEANAHPHKAGGVVVVHNGIIENYLGLKTALTREGHTFKSETDTEILSHLIQSNLFKGLGFEEAVRQALLQVQGSYAVAVLYEGEKDKMIAARKESPLILGLGQGEHFVASDIPAILPYTRRMIFLEDGEMVVLGEDSFRISTLWGEERKRAPKNILWDPVTAEKGGYKHFMLKEIFEQPRAITDTIRGRISLEVGDVSLQESGLTPKVLKEIRRVVIIACGTSYHAALVGKFMIEEIARMPVEVDLGSEFRYRDPLIGPQDLLLAISQSGETTDTLAAFREGKEKKARTLAICNVVDSSLARQSEGLFYTHAGPEIGVASTKAFTCQIVGLFLLAIRLGLTRETLTPKGAKDLLESLAKVPHQAQKVLELNEPIADLSKKYMNARDFLYLGRGVNYPIALEGALKLKEISYIHAEGYPAGEMKHGPIALIDEEVPVVVLAPKGKTYEKILSNIEEVRARGGKVIALANPGSEEIASKAKDVLWIPESHHLLMPILFNIPLQLLAYNIAVLKGTDVDQPRNLAKSVTVE